MPRPRTLWLTALLLAACVATSARDAAATIVVHLPLPELTAEADVVAVATVVASESRWSDDGRLIVTDVTLAVEDGLKGCASGDTLVVRTPGGELDGLGQMVAGVPAFVPGERVMVFLDPSRADPTAPLGLVGLGQGKYTFARTAESPDLDVAIPALDGLTFARVELVPDPQAPGGVKRVVEALDVAVDAEPVPAIDLVEQVRTLVDAQP